MKKTALLLLAFISNLLVAQDIGISNPQITRPSTNVSNLMAFEEIPVSNYTGIPDIKVPLFNLPTRSKDIGLNMFLAYHPANSVMYNAQAGDCGLGWGLFAGGTISRTVIGNPDEAGNGLHYSNVNERDIYQFNFFGHTGRFFINKENDGTLKLKILDNANSKLVFHLDYNPTTYVINTITVFDELGYKFVFDLSDDMVSPSSFISIRYNSAFHLSKIFDNNNQKLIEFTYNNYTLTSYIGNFSDNSYIKKLKEINLLGYGKVNINYNSGTNFTYTDAIRIDNFELKDYNNVSIKKVKLVYSSNLEKVEILSPDETIKENYKFIYKNEFSQDLGTIEKDEWGYKKFMPDCQYTYPIENITEPFYTRYVSDGVLEKMILPTGGNVLFDYEANTFSYYTTTFGMNPNTPNQLINDPAYYTYFLTNPENNIVQTVEYASLSGNQTLTFTIPGTGTSPVSYYLNFNGLPYDYEDPAAIESGVQTYYPFFKINGYRIGDFANSDNITVYHPYPNNSNNLCLGNKMELYPGKTYTIKIFALLPQFANGTVHITKVTPKLNPNLMQHGSGVRVKKVVYFDNQTSTPSKEVNYNYNYFGTSRSSGIQAASYFHEPVGYRNVTVWETGKGKTEYSYTSPFDFNIGQSYAVSETYYDYRRGLLKKQKVFDNSNTVLAESDYDYQYVEDPNPTQFYNNPALNERLGWAKLTKKTTTNYFTSSPAMTLIDEYTYDDNIRKVVKHTTKNSLGETLETQTKYHNTNSTTNRIAEVEEIKTFRNTDLLAQSKVNYSNTFAGNNAYLPNSFASAKGTQPLTTKAKINAYDQHSNPTEVQQEKGIFTTYIWGYNKTKLIAKIENATNAQVATALSVANVSQLTEANLTHINNLRTNIAFANAFITTATYIPLVGVATITDAKGDKMTYEYDAFNRLRLVRDRDNNVVSESRYTTVAAGFGNLNHVTNIAYKTPTLNTIATPTIAQANQSRVYLDGLGRPIQEIAHQQSGTGTDMVSHIEYDQYGRRTINYLPYANSTASLNYNPNAKAGIFSYYADPLKVNETTNTPFSETKLEDSPLQRTLEQSAPGTDWQMGSNNTVKYEYQTNDTGDAVRKFTVNADPSTLPTFGYYNTTLVSNGGYTPGELIKSIVKNENWKATDGDKNTTHTYKDKQGRTILVRTFGESIVSGVMSFSRHDTYYVYDQYGNLTYMIPPKAGGAITTAQLEKLCFQYRYDHKNRLVEKKIPGKTWEYLVYDQLDRVVAMGPTYAPFTNLAGQRGWLLAKYDALGRKVLTAWMTGTTNSTGRKTLQTSYDAETVYNETKTTSDTNISGVLVRYTNVAYPRTGYHVLTVNYFDDYSFTNAPTVFSNTMHNNSQPVFYNNTTQKPKGLATGSWVRVLETTTLYKNETSHVLYDRYARPIRARKTNHLGGYIQTDTRLDWAGKVTYTEVKHKRLNTDPAETYIKEDFAYNSQDRLITHTHQVGLTGTPQILARYAYNALGQNTSKRVGGIASNTNGLQKIDYTYNIRGWLTDINNVNNLAQGTDPKDLFAFKINYNTINNLPGEIGYVDSKAQYNGNISQVYWKTESSPTELRKYDFEYDDLNRLKKAVYQKPGATPTPITNAYNEFIEYDKNGNITQLLRSGNSDASIPTQIDNLTYIYDTDSNDLMKVNDASNASKGFIDLPNITLNREYFYDDFGNLTRDLNKGIGTTTTDGIFYNHLNLPRSINKGADNIIYTYNATGQKVAKTVKVGANTTFTEYLDGFQYKRVNTGATNLEFFGTAEGFYAAGKYHYQYKDHLGNVRMTYCDDNNNGIVATNEIKEENHYFPYGLKHVGYGATPTTTNDAVKYKFNGKELQNELDINVTAMDFRQYDNALGRFLCIDALSEKNHYLSPYNFADANPVFFNDPSGLDSGMPGWMQDMWDASPNNASTTWTNTGNGNFTVTNIQYAAISSGSSSGGGGAGSSGGGGIAGFGIGSSYNFNTGILTTNNGNLYANINSGSNNWNTRTGGDWQSVSAPGVIVLIEGGKYNLNKAVTDVVSSINEILGNGSSGWNLSNNSLNGFDWVGNIAGIASTYPTIDGVWKYHSNSSNTWWRGKNGNYYNKNSVRFNGGYKNSMAWAERTSKTVRGVGSALTWLGIGATIGSTIYAVATDTHNTSTWVGFVAGVGLGALTIVGSPVIVTGAAIAGAIWGISQLVAGDQINGWIDNNFGYR